MDKGLVLVATGDGKGKTTAALGTTLRALGQGLRVAFLQFIKNQETGEGLFLADHAARRPESLFYRRLGLGCFRGKPRPEDLAQAALALALARELAAKDYDLLVLDEICVAQALGLIETAEVVRLIETRRPGLHLFLTGRGAAPEIVALADTVTEMKPVKHAYEKGVPARRGLEF
ncbi:MAG: cob(I)yrinic acid a,c-diamide adenosyltransferase [Candidatus Adiutrix sp.]|jgi:cob(I)alamin adenosyltransferase|nr:cob(I)yrinic acid a,c-diamide adenosyltransferase [Candidatus Adiutrix sp.]